LLQLILGGLRDLPGLYVEVRLLVNRVNWGLVVLERIYSLVLLDVRFLKNFEQFSKILTRLHRFESLVVDVSGLGLPLHGICAT
jgi:hypothetical protein